MLKSANQQFIRKINRTLVLDCVRRRGRAARAEMAATTGLDRKTLTNITADLLTAGLLIESGRRPGATARGRPFILLSFPENLLAAGLQVAPDAVTGVLLDFYGRVRSSHSFEFNTTPDVPAILAAVEKICRHFAPFNGVRGYGVCLPGVLDENAGKVVQSVNIPALNGLNYVQFFSGLIGNKLYFEESSRAAALAEKWFGVGKKHASFVSVDLGAGVGAGIIHNLELFRAAGRPAGEIGHLVIAPDGPVCRCGNRGCLEACIADPICQLASLDDSPNPSGVESNKIPELVAAIGLDLGRALAGVVNLLCPAVISLNGDIVRRHAALLLPAVKRGLTERALPPCLDHLELFASELILAGAKGAATLVLSEYFEVPGHYHIRHENG
jgi:predicted NBD/HSP70 family sugar kinase